MNTIKKIIATFFYSGLSPWAPGTAGTAATACLYALLWQLQIANFKVLLLCLILSCIANLFIGQWAEQHFGTKDPKEVVIDETAGYFLTILLFKPSLTVLVVGFICFRIFDILKPYPIKKVEKAPAGLGILVDDLVAAVYALALLLLASFIAHSYKLDWQMIPSLWLW